MAHQIPLITLYCRSCKYSFILSGPKVYLQHSNSNKQNDKHHESISKSKRQISRHILPDHAKRNTGGATPKNIGCSYLQIRSLHFRYRMDQLILNSMKQIKETLFEFTVLMGLFSILYIVFEILKAIL